MNVAVIGVGNMGKHHARVYTELAGINLVAVADSDKKAGQAVALKNNCKYYVNYHDMLASEKIDAVSIAVPTSLHKNVALACLHNKIPILIEKPIADTILSAQEIIKAEEKTGVSVCMGHIERYNPIIRKLKKLIKQQKFGKLTSIWTKRVGLFPAQIRDADVITDIAVHDIDICNFLLGSNPTSVYATAGKALNSKRLDYAAIFLKYDGVDAILQVNWITPIKVRELTITGTKCYAEVNLLNQSLKMHKSNYERIFDSYGDYMVKFGMPHTEEISVKIQEPLRIEINNFIKFIRARKAAVVTAREGLNALKVCLKAIESAKDNKIKEISNDL